MSRCKTYLGRILAFAMLFSALSSAASAIKVTDTKALSDAIYTSFANDITQLSNPVAIASYDASLRSLTVSNEALFTISAPDREYTVENVGGPQGCYLCVSYVKYSAMTAGEVRGEYEDKLSNKADLTALPYDDSPVYLKSDNRWNDEYFLTAEHTWRSGFTDGTSGSVFHIKEGEKVTFTLPDAQEDDIYSLRVYAYSPNSSEQDDFAFRFFDVLVDTDGVYPDIGADPRENLSFPILDALEVRELDTATATRLPEADILHVFRLAQAYAAAPGQPFTLSNTGAAPGYDISVTVNIYTPKPADEIRRKYENRAIMLNLLPTDNTPVYFCPGADDSVRYLSADGTWGSGSGSAREDKMMRIKAGESVTFTLPEAEEGTLYQISVATGATTYIYSVLSDPNASLKEAPAERPGEGEAPAASGFTDVPSDAYYAEPVAWAVKEGITTGTTQTTFSPDATCTNAQIITLLWRANDMPEPRTDENPFSDVSEADYYYDAALWAYENGLVEGGVFNGSAPCTRAMTVTCLWKLAGMPEAPGASFADVDSGAQYARAVAWAVSEGITTGTDEATFSPDLACTRAQIAAFLYRALAD